MWAGAGEEAAASANIYVCLRIYLSGKTGPCGVRSAPVRSSVRLIRVGAGGDRQMSFPIRIYSIQYRSRKVRLAHRGFSGYLVRYVALGIQPPWALERALRRPIRLSRC